MKKTLVALLAFSSLVFAQATRDNAGFRSITLPKGDDNFTTASIGFPINFFGQSYTSTFVTTNGNITFGTINTIGNDAAWVPTSLSTLNTPMIAPFYADVDTRNSAEITYGNDTVNGRRAFGVNYIGVGYFDRKADKLNSFQVVLIERSDTGQGNFDIEFNYDSIAWDIGENTRIGRAYASVGYTNGLGGAQNASFELPGSLTQNAFVNNGAFALVRQSRNSGGVPGRLVFEVRNGRINNTTLVIQPENTIRSCPEVTILARGSGFNTGSSFILPQFQASLTENGQQRQITNFVATQVTGFAPGTYDFRVSYRSIPVVNDAGVDTNSNVSLSITLPGNSDSPSVTGIDTKVIRNCGVAADCGTLPKEGRVGFSLAGRAAASGGIPPYVFRAPQGVPAGLAFSLDGQLTGAPTTPGNFTYTVRVDDNSTSPVQFGLTRCTLNVLGTATPLTGACAAPAGNAGAAYSGAVTASGGAGGYSFAITGGALPPGLTMSSGGSISGTIAATASGAYAFSTTITDAARATVVVNCSIQVTGIVIPVPTITSFAPTAAVVGAPAFRLNISGSNFTSSSVLVWNGFDLTTTFTSASALIATIPANLLGAPGIAKLSVRNSSTIKTTDADYEVLNPLRITSISPSALRSTGTDTPVVINGEGFFAEATLSLNGTRINAIRVSSTELRATIPASLLQQPGTITLRVDNPNATNAETRLTVAAAITVAPSFSVSRPAVITDQSTAIVTLTQAPGQPIDGVLDVTFVPSADNGPNNGPTDFPRFAASSTRRIAFTIGANATEFRAPIDQGTVAGTATITLSSLSFNGADLLNGQRFTQTLTIDATAPLILPGSVAMVRTPTGFNVELLALSTRRSLTTGSLTFTIASGITNSGSATFTIDSLPALATTWFQSDRGKTEGGGFKLTIPFTLDGDFNNLTSVAVTLSSSAGASPPVSGGRR